MDLGINAMIIGGVGLLNPNITWLFHANGPLDLTVRRWKFVVDRVIWHLIRLRWGRLRMGLGCHLARELNVVHLRRVREHGGCNNM